jgi:hypothetical protein
MPRAIGPFRETSGRRGRHRSDIGENGPQRCHHQHMRTSCEPAKACTATRTMSDETPTGHHYALSYQPHLAATVSSAAKSLFGKLDAKLDPRAFLFLLRHAEAGETPVICIEPPDGPYKPDQFEGVRELAKEFLRNEPGRHGFYTHPVANARRQQKQVYSSLGRAVAECIDGAHSETPWVTYCSAFVTTNGYHIGVVLQLSRHVLSRLPHLNIDSQDGHIAHTSLIECCVNSYMGECHREMTTVQPGEGWSLGRESEEILRRAGVSFMQRASLAGGNQVVS